MILRLEMLFKKSEVTCSEYRGERNRRRVGGWGDIQPRPFSFMGHGWYLFDSMLIVYPTRDTVSDHMTSSMPLLPACIQKELH
jgi:hypothetical protein